MAVDGLSLYLVTNELKEKLINGRIQRSHQPGSKQVVLNIYNNKSNYKLLLNSNAENYRLHLTEQSFDNPFKAPMFCMLLRKHIDGGKIVDIKQAGLERIVEFIVENRDELGNLVKKSLIIELMGRHSNIILLNTNSRKMIDAITRVPYGMSRVRQVLPGMTYETPPSGKIDIFSNYEGYINDLSKDLVNIYEGISPLVARELSSKYETEPLTQSVNYLRDAINNNLFEPSITYGNNGRLYSGALKYTHLGSKFEEFDSMNEALDEHYKLESELKEIRDVKNKLQSVVDNEIKKLRGTIKKQKKQYKDSLKANSYKRHADLIKTNLYQIEEGKKEVTVIDYYNDDMPEITIKLNHKKSPQRNLKEYYKKYEKAVRTQQMTKKHIAKNESELDYLESIAVNIESDDNLISLKEMENELIQSKYIQKQKLSKKTEDEPKSEPRTFSFDGFNIEVGRNNKQNDYLTLRKANKQDIWLHTKGIPGSHVVIRNNGLEVSEDVLLKAANLAAYYSKGKKSSNVPVDYTLVKNVYKRRGSHPGQVFYTDQKTIYVTPNKPE